MNLKILVADIETYWEMFLVGIYIPERDEYLEFEVSRWANQLDSLISFIESHPEHYWVMYNGIRFDSQVIEWVIRNYEKWHEESGIIIANKISKKGSNVIEDSNYDIFPDYREFEISFKQIDVMKVAHYDNKHRRISLKQLQAEMDYENIEETPVPFDKVGLTISDRKAVKHYCKNDVMSTYEFFKVLCGETEHPLYKENNQIQLRFDIHEEFGIDCLNYSDSKVGDEIIKKYYCEELGISYKELPKKGFFRKAIKVKHCVAPYVKFKTPELKGFLKDILKVELGMKTEFKEHIKFYGMVYSFAKGGLHSENKPEIFEEDDEHLIIDWDVSSYYPAIIINNKKYPYHLGKAFLSGYEKMFRKRLDLKPLSKKDKRIKGIVNALKLSVNSVYGKSSDMQSWIYDRQLTMFTTITGELSLMMLIEEYELNGIRVISANTDGVTIKIHKSLLNTMEKINTWWINLTQYELERTDYKKIIFSTVNDYIAIKTDGETKKKGDFLTEFELHKNKSACIVPIAIEKYFIDGISVTETIRNHKNIYDFAIRKKSTRDFHYEGLNFISRVDLLRTKEELIERGWTEWMENTWIRNEWIDQGKPYDRMATKFEQALAIENYKIRKDKAEASNVYDKVIRYYVSLTGEKLYKIKNKDSKSTAPDMSQVEAGEWACTVVNYLPKDYPMDNINYNYYIEKAESMIRKIKTNGKNKSALKVIPNQINLF